MPEQHLRVLAHNSSSESVSLVWTEIMPIVPPPTDHFFKVGTRVDVFVFWRKIVQNFGRGVDTFWGHAYYGFGFRVYLNCLDLVHFRVCDDSKDHIPPRKTHRTMTVVVRSVTIPIPTACPASHDPTFFVARFDVDSCESSWTSGSASAGISTLGSSGVCSETFLDDLPRDLERERPIMYGA
jgi:hypothetical protein